jgi:hypothetical protein
MPHQLNYHLITYYEIYVNYVSIQNKFNLNTKI